jgi:hypothetical protein
MIGSATSSALKSDLSHQERSQERKPAKKRILMVKILKDKHGVLETLISESVKELPPQPVMN